MPEREDRLLPESLNRLVVLVPIYLPAQCTAQGSNQWIPGGRNRRRLDALNAREGGGRHMPSYCGPPPPSGGTQSMIWYGSMMSQVLQWTQLDALICRRFPPEPSSVSIIS